MRVRMWQSFLMTDMRFHSPHTGAQPTATADTVHVVPDLPYRTGTPLTPYEQERCLLDLYVPAGKTACPVLVWFHGGGLQSGDKHEEMNVRLATHFARQGMLVAAANYRLAPQVAYPAFLDDAAAAVAWAVGHAREYGGDPARLFIAGHSAGGYLAACLGMDPGYLAPYGIDTAQIAGVIPISGQTFTHTTIREMRGIANPRHTPLLDEAAPCYHARPDAPPVLALAGDDDLPMRAEENRFFIAMLRTAGHSDATYREIPHRDHTTIASRLPDPGDPVGEAMRVFIERYSRERQE